MQLSSKARKAVAAGLAASTILWAASIGMVTQFASASVHSDGCLVLSGGIVWMITGGTRRGFTSAEVFQSYGYNFAQVNAASAEDVALPVGPIMTYADGTLVKGPSDPLVYLVTGGQKRGFVSGSVFTGLGFSFSNIQSAPANTFADLPTGANIDNASAAHGAGVLVISNGAIWQMTASGRMGFPSASVFLSFGYMFSHVVAANAADLAMPDQGAISMRPACTGGTVVSGSMSVTLASDTPASTVVVTNQGQVDLAHFTFWGNAPVTNVTLKRIGVSADTSLANVYLFNGNTRITDASSVSSGSLITFNNASGLFTVNGQTTISVRADLAANAGESLGVQLVSAMSNSIAFTGAPVQGNLDTVASASLATVSLATATGSGNSDPGTGVMVWQDVVTVGTRDVLMTRLALRQIGSINSTDIQNFVLYVDGTQVAQTQSLDANGYVTFVTSTPLKSGSRTLKVLADVIGGSSRTVQFQLRGAYDISTTDTQYNAGVTATGTFPVGPSSFTVNSGSMTVVKTSDSQSANVTLGASNQSLGKFTFTAFGEPIKVQTLNVGMITNYTTAVTIRNVAIYVNGSQVGSTTNVPAAASFAANSGTQFTTNFTVVPGTPATVEIRGDMVDSNATDDIANGNVTTVQAVIVYGTTLSNGTPQVSLTPIQVPAGANVSGNVLTIASGSLSVAKTSNYANQTVVVPATAYKIGSFVVTGNATEAVNLNTIYVGFDGSETGTPNTDLSSLYVVYGSTTTSPKGTVSSTILNGNSWSINQSLAVNQTMEFDVYATIASSLSTNTIKSTLAVAGITAQSGVAVYADSNSSNSTLDAGFLGQTITGGTGSITATLDGSTPASAIIAANNNTVTTAVYKVQASNDSYTITDLRVTLGDASAVSTVSLNVATNGGTYSPVAGGTLPANTTVNWHGLNIAVPANGYIQIQVQLGLATVGVGAGTSDAALTTTLVGASTTVRNSTGTTSTLSASGSPAGNAIYVYKAIATITPVALPVSGTGSLSAGGSTYTVSQFTITSTNGSIGWQQIIFKIVRSISGTDTLTSPALYDVTGGGSGTQVTSTGSYFTGSVNADNGTSGNFVFIPDAEQTVSGSKTYQLRMTINGTPATNDFITTNIAAVSTYAANLTAFAYNNASGTKLLVSDVDASGTINANDVRESAQVQVTAAGNNTTVVSTPTNNVKDTYGVTNAVHNGLTVIVGSDSSNNLLAFTGTLCALSGWTCTAKTAVDGGGSTVAVGAAVSGIHSIVASATNKQVIFNVTGASTPGAATTTITITVTDNGYGVGSTVASTNSDVGLTLTAGVPAAASFIWSDQSAASHSNTTADWSNDNLVQTIATATQSLVK